VAARGGASAVANAVGPGPPQPFNSSPELGQLALALGQRMWIANVKHALFFSETIEFLE
jgi:hypothetical protein